MIIIISCIANKLEKNILYGEMNKFDDKKKNCAEGFAWQRKILHKQKDLEQKNEISICSLVVKLNNTNHGSWLTLSG